MSRRGPARAVVAIGGHDPSCGAGVVADARTIASFGLLPCSVVTAITVQSGTGVRSSDPLRADAVCRQLDELLATWPIRAVKIGQIPSASIARRLAPMLAEAGLPLVIDPVRSASGGGVLSNRRAAAAVAAELFSLATVVTVNLAEAAELVGFEVTDEAGMEAAARAIAESGPTAVVVKGGHLHGDPVDVLVSRGRVTRFSGTRLGGRSASLHGTGCAFASALAAGLARRMSVVRAVEQARDHVRGLIQGRVTVAGTSVRGPGAGKGC